MAQPIFIFCFLNLVLFVNGDPFDFFQLVQQWGPSTCNNTRGTQCYAQPQPLFTIHGLWPSNNSNARLACQINDQLKEFKVPIFLNIFYVCFLAVFSILAIVSTCFYLRLLRFYQT